MAEYLYNRFADFQALEAEKARVVGIFNEIKSGIKDLNNAGVKIDSSKSIAEMSKAQAEMERLQNKNLQLQRSMDLELEKSRKLKAQASEAEAKQKLAELKLREANEKAIDRERIAEEKRQKAAAAVAQAAQPGSNAAAHMNAIKMQKEAEQADIERAKSIQAQTKAQEELNAAIESAAASGNQRAQLKVDKPISNDDVQAVASYRDNLEQLTGTLAENEQFHVQLKQDLKGVQTEIKDLEKNTSTAEKGTQKYQRQLGELRTEETRLKKEISDTNVTIKNQIKESQAAEGSLERLRARLILLQQAYDRMGTNEKGGILGKAIQIELNQTTEQVKKLEKETGRAQRNVGNYGDAVVQGFKKGFGMLRTLANILPGMGISGIILIMYQGIKKLIDGLDLFSKKMDVTKESAKLLNQALESSSYKNAIENVNELTINVGLAKEGFISKEGVVKQYNETMGKTTGIVKELDEVEQQLTKNGEAYVKMMLYKAAANLALEEAAKFALEAEKTRLRNLDEFGNALADSRVSGGSMGMGGGTFNAKEYDKETERIKKAQADRQNKIIKQQQDDADKAENIAKTFQKKAAEISKTFGFNFFGDNKDEDKDGKKRIEKLRKDAQELFKYRMGLAIEEQKAIASLESYSLKTRIRARQEQARLEKELIEGVTAFELSQADLTADARKLIAEKAAQEIKEAESKGYTDILTIRINTEKAVMAEIERLNAEARARELKEAEEAEKKKAEAKERAIRDLTNKFSEDTRGNQTAGNREVDALRKQLEAGKITLVEYENEKLRIENEYNKKSIQNELAYYIQLSLIAELSGDKQQEYIQKLHELQAKLRKIDLDDFEAVEKRKENIRQQTAQKYRELGAEVANAVSSMLNGAADSEKNEIQDRIDEIETLKAAEIDRINQSADSEEKKAARIAIIEAKAASDREQLERRQRELDMRKAKFDRSFKAFQIMSEGIMAVNKIKLAVLAEPNPILKAAIAAQIPIAIATSAAQMVALLATPLPKFAKGTASSPQGWALVGEEGRELAIEPSGKQVMYEKPTLTYLTKGTKILPNKVTEAVMKANNEDRNKYVTNVSMNQQPIYRSDNSDVVAELKQIKKKTGVVIYNNVPIETTPYFKQQMKY